MANYLYNKTSKIFLYKGGYLEVPAYKYVKVTESDVASGIFESGVMSGDLALYQNEADIPSPPSLTAEKPTTIKDESSGASSEELKAFVEAKRKKELEAVNRYQESAIDPLTPQIIPTENTQSETDSETTESSKIEETAPAAPAPAAKKTRARAE